jgi:type VI secretion system secreted protein Hcp
MAAIRYFLKLGDIKGESTDKTHKDEIEVLSFGWGATQGGGLGGPGGGGGAGKAEVDELTFVATSSLASPPIFAACTTGKHLPEAVLTGRRVGGKGQAQDFLVIKLKEVLITSYSQFAGEAERPEDEVSLVFRELEVVATAGSKTTKATWNATAKKA